MKMISELLLVTTILTGSPDLVGIYEYKSTELSENHYIVFDKVDGKIIGKYFGTHDGKGHGVFFYKADMEKLTIGDNGEIEFEIGDRLLYEETQFKIKDPSPDNSIGRSRDILKYKGQITEGKIKLKCNSDSYDCWTEEFIFEKK